MSDIRETVAEVLRLDAEAAPGKWWVRSDDRTQVLSEDGDLAAHALPKQSALIAYYRTAAPVLAREVRRLQAEIRIDADALAEMLAEARRAGQEAMRGRAAAVCRIRADRYAAQVEQREPGSGGRIVADARSAEAEACVDAIRALEVTHD